MKTHHYLQQWEVKFNHLKEKVKTRLVLTDKQLDTTIRWTGRMSAVGTGSAIIWGGVALVGGAALLLNAAGLGIPAIVGVSTVLTGGLVALKSLATRTIYKAVHKKSVKVKEHRRKQRETSPALSNAPEPAPAFNNAVSPPAHIDAPAPPVQNTPVPAA